MGLEDHVRLLGNIRSPVQLLQACDIYLHLGLNEGAPLAIAEAAMAARPILAAHEGGLPELLTDGVNALLTAADPKSVADCIERMVRSEPLRRRLGNAAREHALANWNSPHIVDQYLELYCA